jgi:hypothetical protein
MTKADRIRKHPNKPSGVVARIVGCSTHDVANLRWRDENRQRFRVKQRVNNRNYRSKLREVAHA